MKNTTSRAARAFSLIELLVVMLIIAIVIGIVLPALGAARDLSRKSASTNLITSITTASASFQNDNRKIPGYFSARDLGSTDNATRGMSGAENMLLELAMPKSAVATQNGTGRIEIGPRNNPATHVFIDPAAVGTTGSYLQVDRKNLVDQTNDGKQIGIADHTAPEGQPQMPDLVDSWGYPILVWSMDEATISPVQAIGDFAREEYTGNANTTSRFYLNSNLCFLNATSLGKRAINQTDAEKGSILGSGVTNMADRVASLVGLLGSPSALTPETATLALAQMLPASPRGSLVVHSAGSNGIYLGKGERGAKQSTDGTLHFGLNFRTGAGQFHMDSNNKPTSVDLRDGFDDIIMAGGN